MSAHAHARPLGTVIGSLVLLAATSNCVERPSEERCRAMADRLVALEVARHQGRAAELATQVAQQHRDDLVHTCLQEGTPAEVECVLGLDSHRDLQRCAPR